ncbi:MAG: complex I subunit 4 family protein [Phycisphaerales bacterium]
MLVALILIPLLAACVVPMVSKQTVKHVALLGTLVPLAIGAVMATQLNWRASSTELLGSQQTYDWFPDLGVTVSLGLNNISALLVGLTLLLGPICVLASFTAITDRVRTYYGWLLVLQSAMTGVFCARDAILFYIFFEFTLVPMFVLISLYGSTNRKAAAIKFFLYTFTGSMIALAGIVYVAWYFTAHAIPALAASGHGVWSFQFSDLKAAANAMSPAEQWWVFVAMLCGFAVKVPLFPLHTWLPLAHTEAPTAGSVVLAGVLLKLGTYAILMIAIPFCPSAAVELAPFIATISIIGILYGGLICWVQTDVKKLVAYSSVAHLGFCMLGMFALNATGVQGSVLYMINHGLSTGALFLCIGMVYERYHTRSMKELGGLAAQMPIWATFMVFFTMASVGLPGTNGFISEFLCILAAFTTGDTWSFHGTGLHTSGAGQLGPWYAVIAGTGMIVAAMYLLYMLGHIVWGALRLPGHDAHAPSHGPSDTHAANGAAHSHGSLPRDLSFREIGVLVPLAALCLAIGLYPKPLTDAIEPQALDLARTMQNYHRSPAAPGMAAAAAETPVPHAEGVMP